MYNYYVMFCNDRITCVENWNNVDLEKFPPKNQDKEIFIHEQPRSHKVSRVHVFEEAEVLTQLIVSGYGLIWGMMVVIVMWSSSINSNFRTWEENPQKIAKMNYKNTFWKSKITTLPNFVTDYRVPEIN